MFRRDSAHGVGLEPLPHLVEEHHGDGLQVVPVLIHRQRQSADGGHGHQEVLVEHLPVADAPERLFQDVMADDGVVRQIAGQPHPPPGGAQPAKGRRTQRLKGQQHQGGRQDPPEHHLLFFRHPALRPLPDDPQHRRQNSHRRQQACLQDLLHDRHPLNN